MYTCECGKEFETHRQLNGHKSVHREGGRYSVSRVKPNAVYHSCLHCDTSFRHSSATTNKFCSNRCQFDFQSSELVKKWIKEGTLVRRHMPIWVKNELRRQRGNCCEVCKITEWNGNPISLDCDHIDGNPLHNHIDNLRLICPNCHSQTPSYKGKNRGNGRKNRYK